MMKRRLEHRWAALVRMAEAALIRPLAVMCESSMACHTCDRLVSRQMIPVRHWLMRMALDWTMASPRPSPPSPNDRWRPWRLEQHHLTAPDQDPCADAATAIRARTSVDFDAASGHVDATVMLAVTFSTGRRSDVAKAAAAAARQSTWPSHAGGASCFRSSRHVD